MNEAPPITNIPPLPPVPPFRDRHTGLLVFGILEILLGVLCVLMAGVTALAQVMVSRTPGTTINSRMMLLGALFYIAFAAIFVWLGIGSIQCRRWARALLLILAWGWLCAGVITVPLMGFFMPRILAASPPNGPALPPGMLTVMVVIQLVFMSVLLVVIPGVLVFFYSSRHVKATCEARDAVLWNDRFRVARYTAGDGPGWPFPVDRLDVVSAQGHWMVGARGHDDCFQPFQHHHLLALGHHGTVSEDGLPAGAD